MTSLPPGYYISISNRAFSPANLAAPPGATVTVINNDAMLHSVTSETTSGAFTHGAVAGVSFDTGAFMGPGVRSFVIPSTAPGGTAVPYYCSVHTSTMATPNATLTVTVGAPPMPPPGGGGGGGGY
jgi:plastocyanin